MRAISLRSGAWAVVVAVSLASCSPLQSEPGDPVPPELDRQRRQWRARDIDSYSYPVRRVCFCPPGLTGPVVVRVRDGHAESRSYAEGGRAVDAEHARFWPTVEGLFDVVQEAIDREAHSISVRYHPELGYPMEIRIDYERMTADEELGLAAYDLQPLRRNTPGPGTAARGLLHGGPPDPPGELPWRSTSPRSKPTCRDPTGSLASC